jgi:hypothetical protein
MERRYLVAALAIIATFAGLSRGFHALQQMSLNQSENYQAVAAARCWANSASQTVAKVRAHFRGGYAPEQAQLVAEMNMPRMESTIAEQMSRQDTAISRCAREKALQQAERARRDAMRAQRDYARAYAFPTPDPTAFAVVAPADLEQRIERTLAKNQMKLEIAQEKLADIEVPAVDVQTEVSAITVPDVKCKVKVSKHAIRDSMHSFQYGFTSR